MVLLALQVLYRREKLPDPKPKEKQLVPLSDLITIDEKFINLFKTYKETNGHMTVGPNYMVPNPDRTNTWPEWSFGFPLGRYAQGLRKEHIKREIEKPIMEELNNLGFIWKPGQHKTEYKVHAFQIYKELHNNSTEIPRGFVVPMNSAHWPKEAWGLPLGNILYFSQWRVGKYNHLKPGLKKLGFIFPSNNILEGFKAYKNAMNSTDLDDAFVVPHRARKFPEATWSMELGQMYKLLRNTTAEVYIRLRTKIKKLGYEVRNDYIALNAFATFKSHFKHFEIPEDFVVPSDTPEWPRITWGLPLGEIHQAVRKHQMFPLIKNKMKRMGYIYGKETLLAEIIDEVAAMSEEDVAKFEAHMTEEQKLLNKRRKRMKILKYLAKNKKLIKRAQELGSAKRKEIRKKAQTAEELRFERANNHLKKILLKRKGAKERKELKRAKRRVMMKEHEAMKLRVKNVKKPLFIFKASKTKKVSTNSRT